MKKLRYSYSSLLKPKQKDFSKKLLNFVELLESFSSYSIEYFDTQHTRSPDYNPNSQGELFVIDTETQEQTLLFTIDQYIFFSMLHEDIFLSLGFNSRAQALKSIIDNALDQSK